MSSLETKISELERELALKKGYQAVTFSLPKSLPSDVAEEIRTKLREIADGLALSREQVPSTGTDDFTPEQKSTLKMLADTVLKKAVSQGSAPQQSQEGQSAQASTVPHHNPQIHVPKPSQVASKKGKILTAENIRGEGKKYAAPEDEIFVSSPDKVDTHGMVSATLMKRGVMIKIPLDDVEFPS